MALTDNILAYWNLENDGSGGVSLLDSTGNGYPLTNNGGVTLGTGIINGGATSSSAGGTSLTNSYISASGAWSISYWTNVSSVSQSGNYSGDISLGNLVSGAIIIHTFGDNSPENGWIFSSAETANYGQFLPTNLNQWYHHVITNDPTYGISWYVDGSPYIVNGGGGTNRDWSEITLGANITNSNASTDSVYDEVGIWNRVLTDNEVFNLYYLGTGNTYPFIKPVIQPELTDNILAYWNLNDDGSGGVSLVDSTGNGYTLTNNGGVTLGTGINGGGAVFNGTNNLSTTQTSPIVGTSSFSYSCWINVDPTTTGFANILGTRTSSGSGFGEWSVLVENLGLINIVQYSGNFDFASSPYNFNTTYFVTVVNDETAGTSSLYINGSLVTTGTLPPSLSAGFPINLGANGDFSQALTGLLDEVGIWNRALTSTEVTALYNSGDGLPYPFGGVYFNAAVDGSLSTLGNWWEDSAFTIPAVALPETTDFVFITSAVTSGTATYSSATITANIGSAVTITAPTTLTNAINSGTLVGNSTLNGTSSNAGTIIGLVVLNGDSENVGEIDGNATFNANTYQEGSGVVFGNASFYGIYGNAGTVNGDAEFYNTTGNIGTITGNATFRDSSGNGYGGDFGTVEGNATVYNPSANPIVGTVLGTTTYLWPNGTGLWGGDVWIDGSLSFIIPDPSEVKAGVEYGPAESPYIGTLSGGSDGIDLARLLGLPAFVRL